MYFSWVRCPFELAQRLLRVALALHKAGSSTPFGVTSSFAEALGGGVLVSLVVGQARVEAARQTTVSGCNAPRAKGAVFVST